MTAGVLEQRTAGPSSRKRSLRNLQLVHGSYRVRFASTDDERSAAFRLRFEVFNLELKEGLTEAYRTGHDTDQFDAVCDQLIAEHVPTRQIVGTYRLQTGITAAANLGYYSEREFDLAAFDPVRSQVVELGRACIHRDHRSSDVLNLLWRGIARYALYHGARYLIGCSSLTSQNPADGMAVYANLRDYLAPADFVVRPRAEFVLCAARAERGSVKVPKLLRAYLAIGAKICGPPAIDREFKTIDFLTLLDLENLHPRIRARFLNA